MPKEDCSTADEAEKVMVVGEEAIAARLKLGDGI